MGFRYELKMQTSSEAKLNLQPECKIAKNQHVLEGCWHSQVS